MSIAVTVVFVLVVGMLAKSTWTNNGRAEDWRRRAIAAEEASGGLRFVLADRSRVLNQRTRQANALIETLASSRGALRETKSSVGALARRQRQLAGDYARAETERRKLAAQRAALASVAAAPERVQLRPRGARRRRPAREAEGGSRARRSRNSRSAASRGHVSARCWGPGDPPRRAGAHARRHRPPRGLRHRRHRRGPDRRPPGLGAGTARGLPGGRGTRAAACASTLARPCSASGARRGPADPRASLRRRLDGARLRGRLAHARCPSRRASGGRMGAGLDCEPALDGARPRERLPRRRARRRAGRPPSFRAGFRSLGASPPARRWSSSPSAAASSGCSPGSSWTASGALRSALGRRCCA